VSLYNSGGYVARFSLIYFVNGYKLEANRSTEAVGLGSKVSKKLDPGTIEDVLVVLEGYNGSHWDVIDIDSDLGLSTECTKCYKVWGKSRTETKAITITSMSSVLRHN
jgi:hypothetical protein